MNVAIQRVLNEKSDVDLIDLKKQMNAILKEIYDLTICVCPWEGRITGGPMLPEQGISIKFQEDKWIIKCSFEFVILGGRARDLYWLKDLKIPALSPTANIWIHHGANSVH